MESFVALVQRRIWLVPLIAAFLLLVAFGFGLVLGWSTVEFKPNARDVLAAADSYSLNNDRELARQRLSGLSKQEQERTVDALIKDANARNRASEAQRLMQLGQVLGLSLTTVAVVTPGGTPFPSGVATPAISGNAATASASLPFGLLILAFLAFFAVIIAAAWFLSARIVPQFRSAPVAKPDLSSRVGLPQKSAPLPRPSPPKVSQPPRVSQPPPRRPAPAPTPAPAPAPVPATPPARTEPLARTEPPPQKQPMGGLGRFVATYNLGNDNYDTSFSLETGKQEFLGECGMGISETIGEGKPDKVTAFDLWLFDKADVRTVTQILMSEYAYNDHTLRTKLTAKGQLVMAEKGKAVELETESLRLKAQVTELVYATDPNFPPNSHFEKLVVEILPALKEPMPA